MAIKAERTQLRTKRAKKPKENESKLQPYDFVRPVQISDEHQISLKIVSDRLAKSIEKQLSSLLRMPVDVNVDRAEHMSFAAFTELLETPCAAFIFRENGAGVEGAIDLGTDCAFYLIDRLFGGSGESVQQGRPLSELEQSILREVVERMLGALKTAWSEHVELNPEITAYASIPENLRTRDRGEVFLTRLAVNMGAQAGIFTFALPHAAIESFVQGVNSRKMARGGGRSEQGGYRSAVESVVRHARLSFAVRLAPHSVSARSLVNLAVGQVIQTNQHAELPIDVSINGRKCFLGTLGQVRQHLAVQITEAPTKATVEKSTPTTSGRVL